MKTIIPKMKDLPKTKWLLIDAKDKVLGRLASKIAIMLRGKDSKYFTPHMPGNVCIVVTNAEQIDITGKKAQNKQYYHHTGYPGGLKSITYEKVVEKKSDFPLKHAVKGMLPKNKLGRQLLFCLKVYPKDKHPHTAQQPVEIEL